MRQNNLLCHAIVFSVGEIFAEFGFEFDHSYFSSDVSCVTKWALRIEVEENDGGTTLVFDEELPIEKHRKVVKLQSGMFYLARVRVYLDDDMSWSAWSEAARTATLHPVVGVIKEIGEDYVRVQWDRPPRIAANTVKEKDFEATRSIADIRDLELRIIRESDMTEAFCSGFAVGTRTCTVHRLNAGTAYIAMIRYKTLINSMRNWTEIGRFYTKPANVISLVARGEDAIKVCWSVGQTPADAVGYVLPETTVHQYEVSVEGENFVKSPVIVPEQQKEYRIEGLSPGTLYTFYVRSLTIEGIWGNRSEPFRVRTAESPEVSVITSGETFLSFTWMRSVEEPEETKVEYCLQSLSTAYKQCDVTEIGPHAEDKAIHLLGLTSGTEYTISLRTFLQGEWGLWTEPQRCRTQSRLLLTIVERGEDFFTLAPESNGEVLRGVRLNVVVTKIGKAGKNFSVLDEEIVYSPDEVGFRVGSLQANTLYEVKCRRWQYNRVTGYEDWGEFSLPVCTRTLQNLALYVWDIGEDFAQLIWRRGLSMTESLDDQSKEQQYPWMDLKYEVVVGCVDTGEDKIVHRQVIQTNYTITNLRPATTYIVSVRACNEFDQWGLWSKVKLRTLASVLTSVHEIGEDFVRLMWERENIVDDDECMSSTESNDSNSISKYNNDDIFGDAAVSNNKDNTSNYGHASNNNINLSNMGHVNHEISDTTTADMFVSRYAVFVFSREDGGSIPSTLSGYHMGGNSEVVRYEVVSSEHTSLRINELLPDREYTAVVRASTATGKWGLWSQPLYFRSNPQFRIPVNNLAIGENYVNLVWSRDARPVVDKNVFVGDLTVTGQQLRIQGVDTSYSKDHTIPADMRELKIYGLSPATAYIIQIRVSGKSGDWGRWSTPVHILTRDTIVTKAVEVAEDYIVIAWERRKVANPKNYPTGRGVVTTYQLRVYNKQGIHSEKFLGDGDSPYRISDVTPDTYYCVEMKANYNDEEWGLWSTPMWCLTMKTLEIQAKLISEEFCCISISRPYQQKRLPEDDGNRATDDRFIAFGQFRTNLMLCVTSPIFHSTPHILNGHVKPRLQNSSLPPDSADHRLIYQSEIFTDFGETDHTIPHLRSNTVYSVSVRSKLVNGEWGMWSQPSLLFATVPTTQIEFTDIGEMFVNVSWNRSKQIIPPQIQDPSVVRLGPGTISASRVKVREIDGSFQETYEVKNSITKLRLDNLSSSSTYAVSVQTYNDNYDWGVWSEESKVRTIPGIEIAIQHISEDAVWVAWARKLDIAEFVNYDTALNVDVTPGTYEVRIVGGGHFEFSKEMDTNTLFFRGLQPDTVYSFQVRAQSGDNQNWGLWSLRSFRTKARIRVRFGNVGEHFAVVEWRRYLPTSLVEQDVNTVVESDDVVQQFRLKMECVGSKTTYVYDLSPYISSFRLKDLQPSSEYRVWLCAKGFGGLWGFWNEEARVRTLPKLELSVQAVGEDYVIVSWMRGKWVGETMGDSEALVHEVDGAVSGYNVRVMDVDGNEVVSQSISFRDTSCTLSSLKLSTIYYVQVSAKDTYDEWGLWSDPKYFMTLESVDLCILKIGEQSVEVEWGRRRDLMRRRRRRLGDVFHDKTNKFFPFRKTIENITVESRNNITKDAFGGEKSIYSSYDRQENGLEKDKSGTTEDDEACVADIGTETKKDYNQLDFNGSDNSGSDEEGYSDDDDSSENNNNCEYDGGALVRGDDGVLQWHLRVQGYRVFGGQPGVEDFAELYVASEEFQHVIGSLLPHAAYTVSVRARDKCGVWGNWSASRKLTTYPLLELTAESVTETSIHVLWNRPDYLVKGLKEFICFPPVTDIHNYQVHIEPLQSEPPFDEREEPLVNGARVYETSQPSMRLWNLTPGVRYRVAVREQNINAEGSFVPDSWGCFSVMQVVETVQPMSVTPIEIGEDYCLVGWSRVKRPADMDSDICFVTGKAKSTAYELSAVRLDGKAIKQYHGPLSLDTVIPLEPSETSYHLENLVSNAIYALRVRARVDGYWGPWSAVTKFVSQSRLEIKVQAVYEDTFVATWCRPLPEWALIRTTSARADGCTEVSSNQPQTALTSSTKGGETLRNVTFCVAVDGSPDENDENDENDDNYDDCSDSNDDHDSKTTSEELQDDLDAVLFGDYSVEMYELHVDGITCDMRRSMLLQKSEMSTCVTGLQHNQIYSVYIRSRSAKQHWSIFSRRESLLTLSPMCVKVLQHNENKALVHWFRAPQDVMDYGAFLEKLRDDEERQCDERERQDLFELKRRAQEMEASAERKYLEDQLALRREHNAALRMDAVYYLQIENITLGNTEVTGYALELGGTAGSTPFISGINRMLLQQQQQQQQLSVQRKHRNESGKKLIGKEQQLQQQLMEIVDDALPEEPSTGDGFVQTVESNFDWLLEDNMLLLDVELRPTVSSLVLKGLAHSSAFLMRLRARNAVGEWCPWSQVEKFTTLQPIDLHYSHFGEHYINLYWHRLPPDLLREMDHDEQQLQEFNRRFSNMSQKDLEEKKKELSDEDYNVLVDQLKNWRKLKRLIADKRMHLMCGGGEVIVHEQTPVKAYKLRIIHENGTFKDYHVSATNNDNGSSNNEERIRSKQDAISSTAVTTTKKSSSNTATSATGISTNSFSNCAFTVTGLVANTMYIALLCADYGFGWGPWTGPLKFMTQNLIQLSIIYISEMFVDIEWHRAKNKRLPPMDRDTTLVSDAVLNDWGRVFQLRITYEDEENGDVVEEYRTMRSCNVFRVDKLRADTKYTLSVREWDAEGDWGLWCAPKTCVTMPGMKTTVQELGEDWAQITWCRKERRVDYDDELDVLQVDLEKVAYYLMVQELQENEALGDASNLSLKETEESSGAFVEEEDMGSIFFSEQLLCGELPKEERPVEFKGEKNGLIYMIQRFNKETVSFRFEGLRSDRFYKVQVMCETTENRLGAWSSEEYFLTLSKITLNANKIDEQYVDITWERMQPRQHQFLSQTRVFTGHYITTAYVLEVTGASNFYFKERIQGSASTMYHLKGLSLNTIYNARVYSINDKEEASLWSDTLRFITLDRIMVQPTEISEHSMILEWGRQLQLPTSEEMGGQYDSSICVGSRESSTYILRVTCSGGSSGDVLLEKTFPGDVCKFHLVSLAPNTPYVVSVRAMNNLAEWGLWSEERCVYTMKLISAEVAAVGEDYIRFCWMREKPDELQIVDTVDNSLFMSERHEVVNEEMGKSLEDEDSVDNFTDTVKKNKQDGDDLVTTKDGLCPSLGDGANTESHVHTYRVSRSVVRKKYPLLDCPEEKSVVYKSINTRIIKYSITVARPEENDDYTIEVSGDATSFTIASLRPDTRYSLDVRAYYESGEWGLSSAKVESGTLNMLAVELRGLGEDYLTVAWQRLPLTYDTKSVSFGIAEETVCYEISLHNFTDVPLGEEDAEELTQRLCQTVFSPAMSRVCVVKELSSNHRYRVSVRRWYRPSGVISDFTLGEVSPADSAHFLELIRAASAKPGKWSECIYDVTLRDMVCTMEDATENSFLVYWERDPRATPQPSLNTFPVMPAQGYCLRIDEMTSDGTAVEAGSSATHIDLSLDATEVSYMAQNMKPDTLYRISVRCCVDSVWGRWSRSLFVMTLPRFVVNIATIAEDYALFSWHRPSRILQLTDGTEIFSGNDDGIDRFHLEVVGVEHKFHVSKKFKAVRNTYRVKQLEANTVYFVSVRCLDSRREAWGLWSERSFFATLKPMRLVVGSVTEQFVTLEWYRSLQVPEEYQELVLDAGAVVHLGNPDVIAYHLCVFMGQHSPSLAVVDKQFPKEVNSYCVGSLDADRPYVVIIRACNTESRWGLWSKEVAFRTQRLLDLSVTAVGENYVRVNWERAEVESENDGRAGYSVSGTKAEPVVYQLLLKTGMETIERVVQASECSLYDGEFKKTSYVMDGLAPMTNYFMALQPGYEHNRWGLWTPAINFKTLQPIAVTAESISTDSVVLSMSRAVETIVSPTSAAESGNEDIENPPLFKGVLRYQVILLKTNEPYRVSEGEYEYDATAAITAAAKKAAGSFGDLTMSKPNFVGDSISTTLSACVAGITEAVKDPQSITIPVADGGDGDYEKITPVTLKDPITDTTIQEDGIALNLCDVTDKSNHRASLQTAEKDFTTLEREIEVVEGDTPNTTCEMNGLTSATSYTARVRAMDENGFWGQYTEFVFETVPLPPRSVILYRLNAQFCMLRWVAPDNRNIYRYVVEQAYTSSESRSKGKGILDWRVVDTVEEESCRIRLTPPPNKMRCRVKAACVGEGHMFSEYCEPVKLSSGIPPEPVTNLAILLLGRNTVTASWTPSKTETGGVSRQTRAVTYRVYLGLRDRTPILLGTTRDASYVFDDLEPQTEYNIQIVVENCDGLSYNNPTIRVMTKSMQDESVTQYEPGQPPLGSPVEPLSLQRQTLLPEIPSARLALAPQPPQSAGRRNRRRGRSVAGGAAATAAAAAEMSAKLEGMQTIPGAGGRPQSTKRRKHIRFPSLKKKKNY